MRTGCVRFSWPAVRDGSDRFDIQARPPEIAKPDNPAMTRALLRDRFKLVAHTETRQEQVYALVLARGDGRLGRSSSRQHRTAQRRSRGSQSMRNEYLDQRHDGAIG